MITTFGISILAFTCQAAKLPSSEIKVNATDYQLISWKKYNSMSDINDYMGYLSSIYDFVTVEEIGRSFENRPMKVLKVCRGGCGHKPAMWIDGGTHAREWISPAVVTWMMKEVVEKDCRHPHLTDKLDWYFLPVLNPDGYEYSRKPGNRMWRKTRSCYEKSCNDTCRGVDPNRNWNYQWNQGGSSEDPCDLTFMGYRPFSEVENQNVRTFILRQKYKIKFFNSLHSYMQAVILPWCYTNDFRPRDFFKMKIMAERGVAALKAVHGYQYSVGNCQSLLRYTVSGVSADWALAVGKIPYSFGMELRPDNFTPGFKLPASEIIPTGQETWAFHEVAAQMIIFEFVP